MVNALEAQNYRLYILRKMEKQKYTLWGKFRVV